MIYPLNAHLLSAWIEICMAIRIIFEHTSCLILILLCDKKFVQFFSTGSNFLHIVITHNKRAPLHASYLFPFESYTTADDENDKKKIFFVSFVKN